MNGETQSKEKKLKEILREYTKSHVCLAFSGGTDSSLLLRMTADAAKENKTKVYAVTFNTVLHPSCDLEIAEKVAKEVGVEHEVLFIDELANPAICRNPENRCYLCKKMLFEKLCAFAEKTGAPVIMEGTNEDDLHVYRPGLQAVKELGVKSPLAEAGLTKEEVRLLARNLGISVADRPASPCLATRLPYGAALETGLLRRVEAGEQYLNTLGFSAVRLRIHGDIARIEVPTKDFPSVLTQNTEIVSHLKKLGFLYVTLDLQGFRSGSMDEVLQKKYSAH